MDTRKQVLYGPYTVTVRKAKVSDGVRRDTLIARAFDQVPKDQAEDDPMRTIAIVMHPSAAACSDFESSEPLPDGALDRFGAVTLDFFASLPDDLVRAWLDVVFDLNPHWNVTGGKSEAEIREKKE
jgi:hypothetical protein